MFRSCIPAACLDLVSLLQVRDRLVEACLDLGVKFQYNSSVEGIRQNRMPESHSSEHFHNWVCDLKDGSKHKSDRLVVATGGLSFPGVGTDGTGHRLMKKLGHEIKETYPALTPLIGPHPSGSNLAGLSLYDVQMHVQLPGSKKSPSSLRSDMLFTHKGFSGPAVLDLSHHVIKVLQEAGAVHQRQASPEKGLQNPSGLTDGPCLRVNWTGVSATVWEERLKVGGLPLVSTVLRRNGIRERLADALCEELGLSQRKMSQLRQPERSALVAALTRFPLPIVGSEGYKKAEVTGGGIPLDQVNCCTMESRIAPNLHLCGEILDVFGRIGGFNFYFAWITGRLAGLGAALGNEVAVKKALKRGGKNVE
jgi:predicted flavoprotein YhiN